MCFSLKLRPDFQGVARKQQTRTWYAAHASKAGQVAVISAQASPNLPCPAPAPGGLRLPSLPKNRRPGVDGCGAMLDMHAHTHKDFCERPAPALCGLQAMVSQASFCRFGKMGSNFVGVGLRGATPPMSVHIHLDVTCADAQRCIALPCMHAEEPPCQEYGQKSSGMPSPLPRAKHTPTETAALR